MPFLLDPATGFLFVEPGSKLQATNCYVLCYFFISKTLCERPLEMSRWAISRLRFKMRNMSSMKKSSIIKPTVCQGLHGFCPQSHDNNREETLRAKKAPARSHS